MSHDSILGANRLKLLEPKESFFGWQALLQRIAPQLRAVFDYLQAPEAKPMWQESDSPPLRVFIFGELFGGGYPNLPSPEGVKPVQTGIYYSPNIEFSAFDLALSFASDPSLRTYVNFEDALRIFNATGLFSVQPIVIGKYEQVVNHPNRFLSEIGTRLGFPAVPDNLAEGIVIRPMRTVLVTTKKGLERAILKSKIAEFSEDRRYHTAEKWDDQPAEPHWESQDTAVADLAYELSSLVTTQRIDNAISKFGPITDPSDRPRMRQLLDIYLSDILDHVKDQFEPQWNSITKEEQEELTKGLKKEAIALFRTHFSISTDSRASSSNSGS